MSITLIDPPELVVVTKDKPWEFWCERLQSDEKAIEFAVARIGNVFFSVDAFLELNRLKSKYSKAKSSL